MITTFKRIMILATMVGCAAVSANAATYTFDDGGVGHDWNTPGNWEPDLKPGADDTAIIPDGLTCEIALAHQSIRFLEIQSGGVVQIKGKDLTMCGSKIPLNRLTVNGRLEFLKPGESEPRLVIAEEELGITGSGVVSASDGDNLDPGFIAGNAIPISALTVNSGELTMKGSLKFRVEIKNNGLILVDDADDVMEIGEMSSQGSQIRILGDDGGWFRASAGTMRFGNCVPDIYNWPESKWQVYGGTLELTQYAGGFWGNAQHGIEVSSGTLELNGSLGTTGGLEFSGGEIKVAAGHVGTFSTR